MPAKVISTANAEHYTWGGPKGADCDGWYMVSTPELQIIEEGMPPGTAETPHHHIRSRQFFYVIEGELTMEIEHHEFAIRTGEGIEIAPGQIHCARNASALGTKSSWYWNTPPWPASG